MKKIITLVLLFFTTIVQAQTTEYAFNKRSNWTIITTSVFDKTFFKIDTYNIDGDTVIDNKSYSKLLRNNNFYAAIRETEDHKIYVYFPDWWDCGELLIYDFDWHPNDTLYQETTYNCYFPEDSVIQVILGNEIDSIQLLDGKYYKYANYFGSTIIRGIGDTGGFFISTFDLPTNGDQYALLCFYIDDVLVYRNPNYSDCNGNSVNIVTVDDDSKIKVYPNPSNHSITVEFPENLDVDVFKIFDTKGTLVGIYEVSGKIQIEVSNLAKGTYVYSAVLKNNQQLSGKIIIK